MIVRESISQFVRGLDPKDSLGLGEVALRRRKWEENMERGLADDGIYAIGVEVLELLKSRSGDLSWEMAAVGRKGVLIENRKNLKIDLVFKEDGEIYLPRWIYKDSSRPIRYMTVPETNIISLGNWINDPEEVIAKLISLINES